MSTKDQLLYSDVHGTAMRYATERRVIFLSRWLVVAKGTVRAVNARCRVVLHLLQPDGTVAVRPNVLFAALGGLLDVISGAG